VQGGGVEEEEVQGDWVEDEDLPEGGVEKEELNAGGVEEEEMQDCGCLTRKSGSLQDGEEGLGGREDGVNHVAGG